MLKWTTKDNKKKGQDTNCIEPIICMEGPRAAFKTSSSLHNCSKQLDACGFGVIFCRSCILYAEK